MSQFPQVINNWPCKNDVTIPYWFMNCVEFCIFEKDWCTPKDLTGMTICVWIKDNLWNVVNKFEVSWDQSQYVLWKVEIPFFICQDADSNISLLPWWCWCYCVFAQEMTAASTMVKHLISYWKLCLINVEEC